jgi:ProP effector
MNKQRLTAALELIGILAKRFPAAFAINPSYRRPLKLGIHRDILAQLGDIIAPRDLSVALRIYVGNLGYLAALTTGADHVDLNGQPTGTVTAEEAAHAKGRCQCWRAKRKTKAKQKQLTVAKPAEPPKPVAAAARRISLADLRMAAQARRVALP